MDQRSKTFLYFHKKTFSYISRNETFLPQAYETSHISGGNFLSEKNKKNRPEKKSLYFGRCNFLAPSLKDACIFSKNSHFSNFQKGTCKACKINNYYISLKKFSQIAC